MKKELLETKKLIIGFKLKKININMIKGPFQHDVCSSALNVNKFVNWKKDKSANMSCHIDYGLMNDPDSSKENYGWICESSAIIIICY